MMSIRELVKTWKLTKKVLGMNSRNLNYIRPYNRKSAKRLADDKLRAKRILKKEKIPVSKTYSIIKDREQLESFNWDSLPNSFVLKPAHGFGGGGIIVTLNKNKRGNWVGVEGKDILKEDLIAHVYNILDGEFALANLPDVVMFEERIKIHKTFKPYSYKGLPDVRVIVFNNVPLMAMLRLPTQESGGRGNISQGALAVGIDMATGVTTTAIKRNVLSHFDTLIEYHPESKLPLSGIQVPYWDEILEISVKCQQITDLGYLGVDIAIDKERGPLVMEINARPGLSVQNANNEGLKGRLNRVEGLKVSTIKKGVRLAKDLFGGEIEEEVEETTGKKVISTVENVKLIGPKDKEIEVQARIDTGAASTSVSTDLVKELGLGETVNKFNALNLEPYYKKILKYKRDGKNLKIIEREMLDRYNKKIPLLEEVIIILSASGVTIRPKVRIQYILDDERINSIVNIVDRTKMKYSMLVGRRDLNRKFLVEVDENIL